MNPQPKKPHILILEDHPDCVEILKYILAAQYDLTILTTLAELKEVTFNDSEFEIFIADLRLPDGEFLEWIIGTNSSLMEKIPTLIVSSVEDIETLRHCFEWGAADYFVKPIRNNEFLIKIENILKSKNTEAAGPSEDFLDDLTMIENKLFLLFNQTPGKLVLRDDILKTVWKKVQVNPKTLDVHLSNLRKKIKNSAYEIDYLGNGWRLITKDLKPAKR